MFEFTIKIRVFRHRSKMIHNMHDIALLNAVIYLLFVVAVSLPMDFASYFFSTLASSSVSSSLPSSSSLIRNSPLQQCYVIIKAIDHLSAILPWHVMYCTFIPGPSCVHRSVCQILFYAWADYQGISANWYENFRRNVFYFSLRWERQIERYRKRENERILPRRSGESNKEDHCLKASEGKDDGRELVETMASVSIQTFAGIALQQWQIPPSKIPFDLNQNRITQNFAVTHILPRESPCIHPIKFTKMIKSFRKQKLRPFPKNYSIDVAAAADQTVSQGRAFKTVY